MGRWKGRRAGSAGGEESDCCQESLFAPSAHFLLNARVGRVRRTSLPEAAELDKEDRGQGHGAFVLDEDGETVAEPDDDSGNVRSRELDFGKFNTLALGTLRATRLRGRDDFLGIRRI